MGFRDVFGHEPAVRALQRGLSGGDLAGTYLISGPQGVGKTTLAQALAQAASCLNPLLHPFDACGVCDSCRRAYSGVHPEIMLIGPAGDQTQIWQFWDRDGRPSGALQRTLKYAPTVGRRRIYIIERADTLTEGAANSLLKVLEEPPPYGLFILLAPQAARLLPTVLSRCQQLRLTKSPNEDLARYLSQAAAITDERARILAAYAEGRTGTALALARSKGVEAELSSVADLARSLATAEPLAALRLSEGVRKQSASLKAMLSADSSDQSAPESGDTVESAPRERASRRQTGIVLELIMAYYRDLLAARLGGENAPLLHADRREEILAASQRKTEKAWARSITHLLKARRRIDQNANPRLVTDAVTVQLIREA